MTEPNSPLPGRVRPRWRRVVPAISIGLAGFLIGFVVVAIPGASSLSPTPFAVVLVFAGPLSFGLAAGIIYNIYARNRETREAERAREELAQAEHRVLVGEEQLSLLELWGLTQTRLTVYHRIATVQAQQSFRNAQYAMAAGFALLVGFSALTFFKAPSDTASVVTGVLGVASAAFAGYIGRTFVRSQECAATHLRAYFDQPLELSRYLAAERLLDDVAPDQRAAVVTELIRAIAVSAPATPRAGTTPRAPTAPAGPPDGPGPLRPEFRWRHAERANQEDIPS